MTFLISNLKPRLFLIVFIVAFVALKVPTLHLAYYWDECWPYATAIKSMHDHGISLLPTALDPNISRGHPLFFHVLGASWMRLFGGSHVSMHSFALLISTLMLVLVYETALAMFSMRAAILTISLVGVQQVFFVQSAMVLFEMLVTLLSFASIVFYVRERYLLSGLSLAMVFFTKESGLIAGFVIGIDAWVSFFNRNIDWKRWIYKLLTVAVPCMLIGIFFLLQKHARGWYVFPMYSEMIEANWGKFWYSFRMSIVHFEFYEQRRWCYLLIVPALAIVAAIKQKSVRYLVALLPAVCIYFMINDQRYNTFLPSAPCFICFIATIIVCIYTYTNKNLLPQLQQRQLTVLSGMFVLCFLIYSNFSFMSARYLLVSIVPLLFLAGAFIDRLIDTTYKWLFYPAITAIAVITFLAYQIPKNVGDTSIGAYDGLVVQQGVVDYLEQQKAYDKKIATGSYLHYMHLREPSTGFLRGNDTFQATFNFTSDVAYFIFDNIEPTTLYPKFKNDTAYRVAYRIERGCAWAEIYQQK